MKYQFKYNMFAHNPNTGTFIRKNETFKNDQKTFLSKSKMDTFESMCSNLQVRIHALEFTYSNLHIRLIKCAKKHHQVQNE